MSFASTVGDFDTYDIDPWEDEEQEPRKKRAPKPDPVHCVHCPGREVTDDGKNGYVHADDLKYSCDLRDKNTTFAEALVR